MKTTILSLVAVMCCLTVVFQPALVIAAEQSAMMLALRGTGEEMVSISDTSLDEISGGAGCIAFKIGCVSLASLAIAGIIVCGVTSLFEK